MGQGAGEEAMGAPAGHTTEWDTRVEAEAPTGVPRGVDEDATCGHEGRGSKDVVDDADAARGSVGTDAQGGRGPMGSRGSLTRVKPADASVEQSMATLEATRTKESPPLRQMTSQLRSPYSLIGTMLQLF